MITKLISIGLMFLLLTSCGDGSSDLYEISLELDEDRVNFLITGLSDQTDNYPPLGKKFFLEGYTNSYVFHRLNDSDQLQIVFSISSDDYLDNFNPNEVNLKSLPDGRPVPLLKKFGGGDGVGNGRVHGGFAKFDSGLYAGIYQNKDSLGFFYPKDLDIGVDTIIKARQNVEKRKGYIALIGKSKQGTQGGALLVLPEPKIKVKIQDPQGGYSR